MIIDLGRYENERKLKGCEAKREERGECSDSGSVLRLPLRDCTNRVGSGGLGERDTVKINVKGQWKRKARRQGMRAISKMII